MRAPDVSRRFRPRLHRVFLFAAIGLAALLAVPGAAIAQSGGDTPTLVILNVPNGGTDRLVSEFRGTGEFTVEKQKWFVEQIRDLGIDPRGIMSSPGNLGRVMRSSGIDYILYMTPEDGNYEARLVSDGSGSPAFTTNVPIADSGLSADGARSLRREILAYIEDQRSPDEPEQKDQPASETEAEAADGASKEAESKEMPGAQGEAGVGASNLLWTTARFRLIKRDLTVAGSNNSVVIYTSTFYPGFQLGGEVYPLGLVDPKLKSAGLTLQFVQGFESIPFKDADGNDIQLSVSQTEFEVGPIFRLEAPEPAATVRRRARVKASVRISNYGVDTNPKLPSTSQTALILGASLTQPLLTEGFAIEADLELMPVIFFGKGGALFGESSTTHGFSTRLGLLYAFTGAWRAVAGYRFRLHHTRFVGKGASNFINSEGFELVQGVDLGLQYRY